MKKVTSPKFSIDKSQIKKGLLMFLFPLALYVVKSLINHALPTDWATWETELGTCAMPVVYWIFSYLQNSEGSITQAEPPVNPAQPIIDRITDHIQTQTAAGIDIATAVQNAADIVSTIK